MKRVITLLLILGAFAPAVAAQRSRTREDDIASRTIRQMTLREKIGQMLVMPLNGEFGNVGGAKFREMERQIRQLHVGGFTLFRGEANSIAILTNEAQKLARFPLFFSADYERGLRMQLRTGTPFTTNMGVAAAGDSRAAFNQGRIICEEMRAIGVNWLFAPVADVNDNPDNPVINIRSFGSDPAMVGEFVEQEVRGIRSANCLSTLKHFPGHGNTATDSHIGLSVISADRKALESVELVPFRKGIEAGTDAVMTAHLALPNITGNNLPATLNPAIISDILRRDLKFDGIITTDSMEMGAITKSYPNGESAVMALKAGVDVILFPPDPDAAIKAVEAAVKRGEISEQRIEESVRRLIKAKIRLGLFRNRLVDPEAANRVVEKPENVAEANRVTERSITLLRNGDAVLPLKADRRRLFITLAADDDPIEGPPFTAEVLRRARDATIVRLDPRSTPDEYTKALVAAENFEEIVIAVFVKRAAAKGTVALPVTQAEFVEKMIALGGKKVVVIAFGSPFMIRQFPAARNYVAAYAIEDIAQMAAVKALFGEIPFRGKLPVTVPDLFRIGDGIETAAQNNR